MAQRISVAEARDGFTRVLRAVETGDPVEITRRGKPVAMLVSSREYDRLRAAGADFWSAVQAFRASVGAGGLQGLHEALSGLRDRGKGREVNL